MVFAAIIYVLVSGCAWRALPPCFGASKSTHRRDRRPDTYRAIASLVSDCTTT